MIGRRIAALATGALLPLMPAGCGDDDAAVAVFAASSLTDVLEDVDGIEVVTAGSQTLVAQLADGADADLLVTADRATMDRAVADGSVAGEPTVIASNALVVAVAPGNPAGIRDPSDLSIADHTIGVCAPAVPCGALAAEASAGLGFELVVDTEEPNVRALATKIALGEVDGGLVYATDAAALSLETVGADELADWRTEYLAASIDAEPADSVAELLDWLIDGDGAARLAASGFGPPDAGGQG